jgi:hypothetical protein
MEHKFKIGQEVLYTPEPFGLSESIDGYQIIRLLSGSGFDPQYRIKRKGDQFERSARQSQLSRRPLGWHHP